jgi:hypothetical protein
MKLLYFQKLMLDGWSTAHQAQLADIMQFNYAQDIPKECQGFLPRSLDFLTAFAHVYNSLG